MKNDRQKTILSIIAEETVETQEQLLSLLLERGIVATQATISRDIKQLHLVKAPAGQGKYRYAVSDFPREHCKCGLRAKPGGHPHHVGPG